MNKPAPNILILLGQRVRSGTNFLGSTLKQHPQVTNLPPDASHGELNLFLSDDILSSVLKKITHYSFGARLKNINEDRFLEMYGDLWLRFLTEHYQMELPKNIFIKSPTLNNWQLWQKAFPQAKIALLSRDGRDNVISSINTSHDKRWWHSPKIKVKKMINYYSGRSFVNSTLLWAQSARDFLNIPESASLKKFKYEGLNNSKEGLKSLLDFFELDSSDANIHRCLNAPVIGSSTTPGSNKYKGPDWSSDTDKSKYQFIGKWTHWNFITKTLFKTLAGKELIALDYEKSNNW